MDTLWMTALWQQLGASVGMLDHAIAACPEELWNDRSRQPEFWYLAFHTLFFLDLYLSGSVEEFVPPPPFTLDELNPQGVLPEKPYTQNELRVYLGYCREKLRTVLSGLTEEKAREPRRFGSSFEGSFVELLLYNLRHIQHHTAQLNLLLRQENGWAPQWVAKAKEQLLSPGA
jgi:uncharacterized damage-inducible protein DinB